MAKRFSRRTTRKKTYKLSPKEAHEVIKNEFTTKYGNKIQKRFIFEPHEPNDPTIKFNIKGSRKEVE